jgi:cytochrome c-type biogenesis protein CcmF
VQDIDDPNSTGVSATPDVSRGGKTLARLSPEKRFYAASEQTTSEVRMHHTPLEDVYVVFANLKEETEAAVIQVWINPLVSWVWLGGFVLVGGTFITLLPNRRERRVQKQKRSVEKLLEEAEAMVAK